MAQLWTTGPAHMYVAFSAGGASTASYLGTAEDAPDLSIESQFSPARNAIGGSAYGTDYRFQGEEAFCAARLTRWDEATYQKLAGRLTNAAAPGAQVTGQVGALMNQENLNFQLFLQFPYQQFAAFAGLPPGYRFVSALFEGPDRRRGGTNENVLDVAFHCIRRVSADASYTLYDFNVSGLPQPT